MTSTAVEAAPVLDSTPPPTSVPCPDWCETGQGHGYDMLGGDDREDPCRHHRRVFGDERGDLFVDVVATGTWTAGGEDVDDLALSAWIDGNVALDDITLARARELGNLLIAAADWNDAREAHS